MTTYTKICSICGKEFESNTPSRKLCTVPHPVICEKCGKVFYVEGRDSSRRKLCDTCVKESKMKVCPLCGNKFIPSTRQKYCQGPHLRKCKQCGKEFDYTKNLNQEFCSKKCRGKYDKEHGIAQKRSEKAKDTWNEKYGVDNPAKLDSVKEKKKQTSLKHYGVEHPWLDSKVQKKRQETLIKNHGSITPMKDPNVVKKAEATNLEKYGFKRPAQNKNIKDKTRKYFQETYGVNAAMQVPEFKQKYIDTSREKYGVDYAYLSDESRKRANETRRKRYGNESFVGTDAWKIKTEQTLLKKYGVHYAGELKELHEKAERTMMEKYGVKYGVFVSPENQSKVSKINILFSEYLQSKGIDNKLEFALPDKSYDIKAGNTLIEINPTYTHNSYKSHFYPEGLPVLYHIERTQYAEQHGYRCIQVFDWDDWSKIVSLISNKETLYARKCTLQEVPVKDALLFLKVNHLQGPCRNNKVCIGLYFEGNLVGLMTLGSPRYNKNYQWEILRMCFDSRYRIVGGSERMFKYFIRTYNPDSIISYCDCSKFTGKIYRKLGMVQKGKLVPRKHWYSLNEKNKPRHITDNLLRQRGYDSIFKENYGKGTNNEELILNKGYLPVYDCGQMTFVWYKEKVRKLVYEKPDRILSNSEILSHNLVGRVHMYNPKTGKRVMCFPEQVNEYLQLGFVKGRPKNNTNQLYWMHNDTLKKNIRISKDEISLYVQQGWKQGQVRFNKKN